MTLGLRGRLLVASVVVITLSVVVAEGVLRRGLVAELKQRIRSDLAVRASLAADSVSREKLAARADPRWSSLARELSDRMQARVTFIARDGAVLGDSQASENALAAGGNHLDRAELTEALAAGVGHSVRHSPTVGARMMYVAHAFESVGGDTVVARVALPLTEVEEAVASLWRLVAIGSLAALLVAVVLSSAGAHWASQNARRLAEAARRLADGDFSTRTHATSSDEFGELGGTLDKLATRLSSAFNDLRAERDLLGGILSGMGEGVLLVDDAGRVVLVNHGLREMLLIGDDAVGRELAEVVRDRQLHSIIDKARQTKATASVELETAGIKPRRFLVRALSLSPQPFGTLAVFVDVTDLRRLEKLRRDFVANVSHELRTPVTAIRSATETLLEGAAHDPAAMPVFVDMIDRNAQRLHALVEDLLDLSRLESREYRLETASVHLQDVVARTLSMFDERAARKGVRLTSVMGDDAVFVQADPRALEQVLTNLLENAIKYCQPDSTIEVRAERESASTVRVSLSDSGPGIEAKHLSRIFERFYRIDKGRSRDIGGTGLGLSIVKHLVEAMDGVVGVESVPGRGSTFWFTMPRDEDNPLPEPSLASSTSERSSA